MADKKTAGSRIIHIVLLNVLLFCPYAKRVLNPTVQTLFLISFHLDCGICTPSSASYGIAYLISPVD